MPDTLYATFPNFELAERAVGALLDHGGSPDCISLVVDEKIHLMRQPQTSLDTMDPVEGAQRGVTTTTSGDAALGALRGAGIGLGVGTLAAIASLIIPGFGLVIGGGALAMAVGAAAATTVAGAISGGVAGYLIDQGVPEKVAGVYEEELASGRCLLALAAPCGELDRQTVLSLLDKYGAGNVGAYVLGGEPRTPSQPVMIDETRITVEES